MNRPFRTPSRESLACFQAGLVVIASAWMLGGIGHPFEWIVAALSAPALILLLCEWQARRQAGDSAGARRMLRWVVPLVLLALFIATSALNPSHTIAVLQGIEVLRPLRPIPWLPTSADPAETWRSLACFGGLALIGLNLTFCVHSRRKLRTLFAVLVLNGLALAILGTLQRQSGATGPGFGWITSPNPTWFATFLYHNHWGAFAILLTASAFALAFQLLREPLPRGWLHSPGPMLIVAALLLAATAPLSGSRSCTVLATCLCLAAAAWAQTKLVRRPSVLSVVNWTPTVLFLALVALVAWQSRDILERRLDETLAAWRAIGGDATRYTRSELYADTWRMALDRPVAGWGLGAYGAIFIRYNTTRPDINGIVTHYEDAHSDWLQSLAETGFVGTSLLLLFGLLPAAETFARRGRPGPFTTWLLSGCALVAAYAWVEFPFANPAVVALWWTTWFAALRHHQLSLSHTPRTPVRVLRPDPHPQRSP